MTKRVVSVILVLMLVCIIPMNIALATVCPKCGKSYNNGERFCWECGVQLPESTATPIPTPKVTKRPTVTATPKVTATPTKLDVVTNLKVTKATKDSLTITWNKVKNAQKYVVEYKKSSETQWKEATSSCKKEKYTIKKLEAGTEYDIRVCAVNGKSRSDYNLLTNNTTKAAATAKPTNTPKPINKETISVGDYVTFGTYPQTASGKDNTPIEWLVLSVNGQKALLLSKYGLDAQRYNTSNKAVTWETCTLRKWLNSTFMNKAFTLTEQGAICTTNVDNSKSQGDSKWNTNGGNKTVDKIFLFSCAEARKYLNVRFRGENYSNTESRVAPTAYAIKQGAPLSSYGRKTAEGKTAGQWWLRSPGGSLYDAAAVDVDGSLINANVQARYSVRPALWVNLESEFFK